MIDLPRPCQPEDVLADGDGHAEIDGTSARKGTVAAFLRNARRWNEAELPADERALLTEAIAHAVPVLRALGLFDVLDVRDPALRALIDAC
ncbi:hypothetical protein K7957_17775 [Sphingomonas yunnanensis]|uniref:DUF7709 family protein n=1 Tax=Sphingomonas yunnanensis TaxID=310400 RepID=UPI001CA66775|nr:hypothetical protein [Sphingomonas yunnanensis]MBY9064790.1 hypothetical protein [Sphingomonas yunnanensis]